MKTRFEISQNSSKGKLKPTTYKTYQKETRQMKRNSHERTDNASGDLDIILFFPLENIFVRIESRVTSGKIQNPADA